MSHTIAIVAAGAMGSAVAARLTAAGCTVLTNLDGRSDATRRRALEAGMIDVPFTDIPRRASCMLSIIPPSDAQSLAERYLEACRASANAGVATPVYVDCNAVNPQTVKGIATLFKQTGVGFVDAGIIGGPPRVGYFPTFYASADQHDLFALGALEELRTYGMKLAVLKGDGAGAGDASALKMSYAGITKGLTGLFTTMILSANAASPATTTALLRELHASQPALLQRATRSIPDMLPKAYRWIGEMEEISEFVGEPLQDVHKGMSNVYRRVRDSVDGDGDDQRVLEKFVKDAIEILEKEKESI